MVSFIKTGAWNLTKHEEHTKSNTLLAFSEN